MIARTEIDKCFSTALNGHGAFNFNPEEKRLAKSKTKDKAEIAYTGMAGGVADKVESIFRKVERVAVYA